MNKSILVQEIYRCVYFVCMLCIHCCMFLYIFMCARSTNGCIHKTVSKSIAIWGVTNATSGLSVLMTLFVSIVRVSPSFGSGQESKMCVRANRREYSYLALLRHAFLTSMYPTIYKPHIQVFC